MYEEPQLQENDPILRLNKLLSRIEILSFQFFKEFTSNNVSTKLIHLKTLILTWVNLFRESKDLGVASDPATLYFYESTLSLIEEVSYLEEDKFIELISLTVSRIQSLNALVQLKASITESTTTEYVVKVIKNIFDAKTASLVILATLKSSSNSWTSDVAEREALYAAAQIVELICLVQNSQIIDMDQIPVALDLLFVFNPNYWGEEIKETYKILFGQELTDDQIQIFLEKISQITGKY
jgi:hypothetical protein